MSERKGFISRTRARLKTAAGILDEMERPWPCTTTVGEVQAMADLRFFEALLRSWPELDGRAES